MSGSMLGLISLGPQGDAEAQERRAELVPATTGEVFGGAIAEGFQESVGPRLARVVRRGYVDAGDGNYAPLNAFDENEQPTGLLPPSPMVPLDVLKREYEIPGVLSFDKDTPQSVAQSLYEHKRDQMARADAVRRADNMLTQGMAARFVGGMIGSLADPVNIAAMFVPGLRESTVARMAGVGPGASALARAGVRAGAGASAGAAGMIALEPLNAVLMAQERDDWTMAGALANVLFGTVAGAGFHSGLGALAERTRGLPEWAPARAFSEQMQTAAPEVQEALARSAMASTIEGRPAEVAPLADLYASLAPDPWRGATVVADADGAPLRVYHGTTRTFDEFSSAELGSNTGAASANRAHFFAADPSTSHSYAADEAYGEWLWARDEAAEAARRRADPALLAQHAAEQRSRAVGHLHDHLSGPYMFEGNEAAPTPKQIREMAERLVALEDAPDSVDIRGEVRAILRTTLNEEATARVMLNEDMRGALQRKGGTLEDIYGPRAKLADVELDVGRFEDWEGAPNIRPSNIRLTNPLIHDYAGQARASDTFDSLLARAQAEGRDGAIFRNVSDGGPKTDIYAVFDPANIRPSWLADAERLRDAKTAMANLEAAQRPNPADAMPPPAVTRTGAAPPDPKPPGEIGALAKDIAEVEKQTADMDALLRVQEGDAGFTTAKGSTYVLHEDGTTSRNKAPRPEHPGDAGPKHRSAKTVFLSESDAKRLAPPQGHWRIVEEAPGTLTLVTRTDGAERWGAAPSQRRVQYTAEPSVGAIPLELWAPQTVAGTPAFGEAHFGNSITEMRGGALRDLIRKYDALVDEETKIDTALFDAAAACIVRNR